ncbi:HAD family hydrolase [Croceiramulus getboli]|nr:HAD family phosphatase [Flavobacteriaceae bacterium YJPT1-3]
MIKNIIFDFGDVFINLDKQATIQAFQELNLTEFTESLQEVNQAYECGKVSSTAFAKAYKNHLPSTIEEGQLYKAWNAMIADFPEYRLQWIEALAAAQDYRLFLLSNTNAWHIEQVQENMGLDRYQRFVNCFEAFYLSHELGMRKPNADCYKHLLHHHELTPIETLFIDDTLENTQAADRLGIKTWNLQPGREDVIALRTLKKELF